MLDYFLENNIQKKLHIFSILYLKDTISVKELAEKVRISPTSVSSLIDDLNFDLQGIAEIKKISALYEIEIYEEVSFFDILQAIYQSSNVLKCLRFMINNDTNISFSEFSEEHFLTRPTAYRIRENCVRYLNEIGLDIQKNKIVGDEYRIRFLIGLLYYRYGIDCCGIDKNSIRLAREFILSTNDKIDMDFLERTSNEYGYFECLLILSWKRKDYPVRLEKSEDLERLKKLFIFPKLKKHFKETVESKLNLTFSEEDYDYIFLIYCCTNSCVLADKWTPGDLESVHKIVFSTPKFKDLLSRFEKQYCAALAQSRAFRIVIIYFLKKCLFNLHCIIPDKNLYLDTKTDSLKRMILQCTTNIIGVWKNKNNIPYRIDEGHLQYLAIQIASIAPQFMKPVKIMVVSDLRSEVEVIKLHLTRAFSHHRVTVRSVLFNAQDLTFMSHLKNSVIVVKKVFAPAVASLKISKSNRIVPIHIEINALDKQSIVNAVRACENDIFLDFITR